MLDSPGIVKRPIGVFDSGVGGLSILKALRAELPFEDFTYLADNGFSPYGERDEAFVIERARRIARHLTTSEQTPIKALVIACNTATAAAIHLLRQDDPALPIVGVEPALKPAVAASRTRRIGVLATRGTLGSQKFNTLRASLRAQAEFVCQPCDGLAAAIEGDNAPEIKALCAEYIRATGQFGINHGEIDTLVLGCTHYPFAGAVFRQLVGPDVHLVDNGEPVARQTRRVLTDLAPPVQTGAVTLCTTGHAASLALAARRWLGLKIPVRTLSL